MIALRIFVLACASAEQFPNKSVFIKTLPVTSNNLQSMFLQCMSFIIVHWTVEIVMRSRINIKTATASWTEFILKTMFEIVFKQMT